MYVHVHHMHIYAGIRNNIYMHACVHIKQKVHMLVCMRLKSANGMASHLTGSEAKAGAGSATKSIDLRLQNQRFLNFCLVTSSSGGWSQTAKVVKHENAGELYRNKCGLPPKNGMHVLEQPCTASD